MIGLWQKRHADGDGGEFAPPHLATGDESAPPATVEEPELLLDEQDEVDGHSKRRFIAGLLASGAALGWVGTLGWHRFAGPAAQALTFDTALSFISTASMPLALIGVAWLLAMRSSASETRRFAGTAAAVRAEQARLETTLGRINATINASRERLGEQSAQLLNLGDGAAERIDVMTKAMATDVQQLGRQADMLKISAAAARSDIAVLLASLPKAQVQARQMVSALQEAALSVEERAGSLDAHLSLLIARGRDADEIAGGAAKALATHLASVEKASEAASLRLETTAGQMTGVVDTALEKAADALNTARSGMEAQAAAMLAMIEQSQAAAARAGAEAAEELRGRLAAIQTQSDAVSTALATQNAEAQALQSRLDGDIKAVEERLEELGSTGDRSIGKFAATFGALRDNADSLSATLERGGDNARALIERSETLLTALDAVAREIDETLPGAYDRLDAKARVTLDLVGQTTPQVSETARLAEETATRLAQAETLLSGQQAAMAQFGETASRTLNDSQNTVSSLARSVADLDGQLAGLSEGAGPKLVEALLRVRETASQAAEHARETLGSVIPASAAALGEQSKTALSEALTAQVETQIGEIARVTEQAVAAAQAATDRLMRQMLTISETSSALEARIAEAKREVEDSDQANFSRRVALLIESLNSTAIDVTKILSNDVTDSAWAAYLRGDRGVFTRRAVRLLDNADVKEVLRHYQEEPEFRQHVNRYIHDFESMLRNVLATREGSALGVTLLSSDTGKLYVALAQAIERLRN